MDLSTSQVEALVAENMRLKYEVQVLQMLLEKEEVNEEEVEEESSNETEADSDHEEHDFTTDDSSNEGNKDPKDDTSKTTEGERTPAKPKKLTVVEQILAKVAEEKKSMAVDKAVDSMVIIKKEVFDEIKDEREQSKSARVPKLLLRRRGGRWETGRAGEKRRRIAKRWEKEEEEEKEDDQEGKLGEDREKDERGEVADISRLLLRWSSELR